MATFSKISNLCNEATIEFIYDDTEMKMTGVKLVNNSKQYLDIFLISPLVSSLRINPGKSFDKTFFTIEKSSYQFVDVEKNWGIAKIVGGIEWRCCLGV